jgi:HlyD family secretion protein
MLHRIVRVGSAAAVLRLLPLAVTLALPTAAPAQTSGTAGAAGMAVTVMKATRTCFTDMLQVSGVLMPREEILVRPEIEGLQVSHILAEDGDRVTSGQVLARLVRPGAEGQAATPVTVRAPAAGIVNHRAVRIGMMASARAPQPLFRIVVNGDVELEGSVPATRVTKLAAGQPAKVEIAGLGEAIGKVRTVSPQIDQGSQLGQARISVGNDEKFKVGAYARAQVEVGRSCGATIPLSAVLYGPEGAVVQVVRDDRVETRRVRVGLLSGGNAEIREGLNEGDLVVARAGAFLREGDRVRPIEARATPTTTTR